MLRPIDRSVPDLGARGILAKIVIALPVPRRPDRSRHKPSAAVRADVAKNALDAFRAESALVGANARLERIWRKRLVAVFAGRSEFQHGVSSGGY